MESLLKLSGLLPDGDDNADLGDIERRLQESSKARSTLGRSSSESTAATPSVSTPRSAADSPKCGKTGNGEEDVEALSEQLCSLVTDNSGETRFIGNSHRAKPSAMLGLTGIQALPRDFLSSRLRESSG